MDTMDNGHHGRRAPRHGHHGHHGQDGQHGHQGPEGDRPSGGARHGQWTKPRQRKGGGGNSNGVPRLSIGSQRRASGALLPVLCPCAPPPVLDVLFVLAVLAVLGVLPGAPAPAVAWVVCASGPALGKRVPVHGSQRRKAARRCQSIVLARPIPSILSMMSILSACPASMMSIVHWRARSSGSVGRLCKRPGVVQACPP
jgi:hypothetical protein